MWITIMGLALSMLTNVQYRMAPYSPYGGAVTVHYISSRSSQLSVVALEMGITKSVVQTRRCWNVQKRRLQIIKQTAFSLWVRPFFLRSDIQSLFSSLLMHSSNRFIRLLNL